LQDDTAYVFKKSMLATVVMMEKRSNYCRYVDDLILCSLKEGFSGAAPSLSQDVPILRSGMVIPFTNAQPDSDKLVDARWWDKESFGRWMIGTSASMLLKVSPHPQRDVRVNLTLMPFVRPSHTSQRLGIIGNGKLLLQASFDQPSTSDVQLVIPRDLVGEDGSVRLDFDLPDAVSPNSLAQNGDNRVLSFAVTQLRVEESGN